MRRAVQFWPPIVAVMAVLAALPAGALAGGGPPPKLCPQETVRDYLAQTRAFPKLRPFPVGELPRRFGPPGFDTSPPLELPNTGQVLGPSFRYFGPGDRVSLDLDLTLILTRLNGRGHPLGRPAVKRVRLRSLSGSGERTVGLRISGRPALYRIVMEARNGAGRALGRYGQYIRVVRRRSDPRLLLGDYTLRPGETTEIGVAEFGTGFLVFTPHYSVEAFDGTNWAPTAIEARTPSNILGPLADSGTAVVCSKLAIPAATPPGRYRISQAVEHRWGVPRPGPVHSVLSAEFEVAQ
jgi:hypothetical protein